MSVPDRRTGGRYLWQRDLKLEARAKTNFLHRSGVLFGVLFSWFVVGTGWSSFIQLSIGAVVVFFALTMWDGWKMWKGKQNG